MAQAAASTIRVPHGADGRRGAARAEVGAAGRATARPAARRPLPAHPEQRRAAEARRGFAAFLVLFGGLAVVMGTTVWLRTACAENAYTLSRLTSELQAERQATEALRVRVLSLGTPGRIEAVAARRLSMVEPQQITFLRRQLPAQRTAPRREAPRRRPDTWSRATAWLRSASQDLTILSLGELGLPPAGG